MGGASAAATPSVHSARRQEPMHVTRERSARPKRLARARLGVVSFSKLGNESGSLSSVCIKYVINLISKCF